MFNLSNQHEDRISRPVVPVSVSFILPESPDQLYNCQPSDLSPCVTLCKAHALGVENRGGNILESVEDGACRYCQPAEV